MHAVVLVGGFGTRLRPLTHDVPKPMLPIGHRPMIVRLVERLAASGVTDVVLALGFHPEPFHDAFPGDHLDDVRIRYATEPEPLDTAGAIAFAAREVGIDDTFVVANGDIISDVGIDELIATHRRLGAAATLHLTPVDDPSAYGVVEIDEAGMVRRFVEKPGAGDSESNLVNAGTYVMEPGVLDLIEPDRRVSVERDTFPQLVERGQLAGAPIGGYWTDAGRPGPYRLANLATVGFDDEPPVHPDAMLGARVTVTNSIIGRGAVIGDDAVVSDSVVMPDGIVGAGARCERSIIAGELVAGGRATDAVLGAGASTADLVDARHPD